MITIEKRSSFECLKRYFNLYLATPKWSTLKEFTLLLINLQLHQSKNSRENMYKNATMYKIIFASYIFSQIKTNFVFLINANVKYNSSEYNFNESIH